MNPREHFSDADITLSAERAPLGVELPHVDKILASQGYRKAARLNFAAAAYEFATGVEVNRAGYGHHKLLPSNDTMMLSVITKGAAGNQSFHVVGAITTLGHLRQELREHKVTVKEIGLAQFIQHSASMDVDQIMKKLATHVAPNECGPGTSALPTPALG